MRSMNCSEYVHHLSSSSERTGTVTSSTSSSSPSRLACTKHLLNGMFLTHSVRSSL